MKQSEQEEEQNRQKHVEKRMQSMLALKKDITNNRVQLFLFEPLMSYSKIYKFSYNCLKKSL